MDGFLVQLNSRLHRHFRLLVTLEMAFPQPIKPDFLHCGLFFAEPDQPIWNDCRAAWNNLVTGHDPVQYRSLGRIYEANGLLLTETAGQ